MVRRVMVVAAAVAMAACSGGNDDDAAESPTSMTVSEAITSASSPPVVAATEATAKAIETTEPETTEPETTEPRVPDAMPNLVGRTLEDARAEVAPYNVRITVRNAISPSRTGTVIEQDPIGGAKFSTNITFVVSVEPPPVPDVVGMTVGDAIPVLQDQGFEVEEVDILDEAAADGEVLAQDPPAGTENAGTVMISIARRPQVVYLTDLTPTESSNSENGQYDTNGQTYEQSFRLYVNASREDNLSKDYRQLRMTVGVEDTSDSSAVFKLNVLGDDRSLITKEFAFGISEDVTLDVSDVLRLRIEVSQLSGDRSWFVIGNPRLYGIPDEVSPGG